MGTRLTWDQVKRAANLRKHGLDFADAGEVLDSRYRMDVPVLRGGEVRVQSFAYVLRRLRVLTVVHTDRGCSVRIVSYRPASEREAEAYHDWLSKEDD